VVDYRQKGHVATKACQVTGGLHYGCHACVFVRLQRLDQQLSLAFHGRALNGKNRLLRRNSHGSTTANDIPRIRKRNVAVSKLSAVSRFPVHSYLVSIGRKSDDLRDVSLSVPSTSSLENSPAGIVEIESSSGWIFRDKARAVVDTQIPTAEAYSSGTIGGGLRLASGKDWFATMSR